MKLVPVGRTPVAKRVQEAILACRTDEEAQLLATMIIAKGLEHDFESYHAPLQTNINKCVEAQVNEVSKRLARTTIYKAQRGEDIDSLLQMQVEIKKAFDYTDEERRAFTRKQERNALGQFRTSHHRVNYSGGKKPVPDKYAEKFGVKPTNLAQMAPKDKLAYQEAYQQIQTLLGPYAALPEGESVLHLTYTGRNGGNRSTETVDMPGVTQNGRHDLSGVIDANKFREGKRIAAASVSVNPNLSVQGAAFDLVGALGETPGSMAARGFNRRGDTAQFEGAAQLGSFADQWNKTATAPENIGTHRGLFGRLGMGSRLLSAMGGENAPAKVKLALQTGEFVSQYGQEAEKVIGPHADRIAYRYRGVERKPEPALQANIDRYRGLYKDPNAARNALIYGTPDETATRGGITSTPKASPLVEYFRGRLADKDLIQLQSQSGVIPPSEGVIIDRKGKIVTQAVGYGDDWYLPFNLKTLSQVKGGEYVRTRAWGGPTTEDIYGGLVSGARAVTVISHNGVYTIEFDPAFRGTRRYNDKAARMVKRYGHLLDAVKSKQVTLSGIPEDRLTELKTEAARRYDPKNDRKRFNERLDELKKEERIEPQMSAAYRSQLARDFLDEQAVNLPGKYGKEHEASWTDFATAYVDREVGMHRRNHPAAAGEFDEAFYRDMASSSVRTPEQVVAVSGLDQQWQKYLGAKEAEYKAEQSPLNLDGPGYDKSLKALKEQFPYYISNVSWQPNRIGGTDPGYVKPKHNRPERALAGYFDTTIDGAGKQLTADGKATGKITADQIRYQNGRTPDRYEARGASARPSDGGQGGGITPNRPGGSPASPVAQALQQQDAVEKLWDYYNGKTVFDKGPGQDKAVSRQVMITEGMPLLFGSKDELLAAHNSNPEQTKQRLQAELAKANLVFHEPTELLARFRDPKAFERGGTYTTLAGMASPNKNYDFGAEFEAGRTPEEYEGTIHGILDKLGVQSPGQGLDDSALDSTLGQVHAQAADLIKRDAQVAGGIGIDINREEERVKLVVQARQALRRRQKALQDKAAADAARAQREAETNGRTIPITLGFEGPQGTVRITQPMGQLNINDARAAYDDDALRRLSGQ